MKTLTVYDSKTGDLVFTQGNANQEYACLVEDIEDDKEIIGVDIKTNKCILVSRQATTDEKNQLKIELDNKNAELARKDEVITSKDNQLAIKDEEIDKVNTELLKTQSAIVDMTYDNLLK